MEDFKVNYYADHVKFMLFLLDNRNEINTLESCSGKFSCVTEEALLRDIGSRAYYASYLSARDKLVSANMLADQASVNHTGVKNKLSRQFKTFLMELKEIREKADYDTKTIFNFPQSTTTTKLYPLVRLESIMGRFVNGTANSITP